MDEKKVERFVPLVALLLLMGLVYYGAQKPKPASGWADCSTPSTDATDKYWCGN